ncbi:tetratricopeptide repeat protein [Kitasatospora sp. NBC_01250]|uniref:tetratricopeptide repeat protein n=1 Tax=Kitasatospora sp. NBC_01250 TaxID=2903571 RepID=UPI002E31930C|nr:tetratricopeptide repeat protein [Kitasatospora sp. NBC_01250]
MGTTEDESATRNLITGAARISGGVIQAGAIHGTVHLHGAGPAAAPPPVPQQLPPPTGPFVGRRAELAALGELRGGPADCRRLIVVNGPAGVGKTALVLAWVRSLAADCPDGLLYADLRGHAPGGPAPAGETLGALLRAFGVERVPGAPAEAAALWRSVSAGRRIALVLDNALTAAQVRQLLPGSQSALVVVASRNRLSGLGVDGAVFQPLGLLDESAAAEILTRRIGPARAGREPEAVREVAAHCGGLALAVSLVAARVAARPRLTLAATAASLASDSERLTALRVDGEPAVRSALDASCGGLVPGVRRLYQLLGLLPFTDFSTEDAAVLTGAAFADADALLDELAEANLIEDLGTGRFRFHDLVRLHARDQVRGELAKDEQDAVLRRILEWYLATATAAERLLTPNHATLRRDHTCPPAAPPFGAADSQAALRWLDQERGHLLEGVRAAAAHGWFPLGWQLVDAMYPLFHRLRAFELQDEAHRLGLAAARRADDPAALARMLTDGGGRLRNLGRPEEAIRRYQEALELAQADGDAKAEAQALHGIGQAHLLAGRLAEATRCFREDLALRLSVGYARGAALTRVVLGDVALAQRRPDLALPELTVAYQTLMDIGEPYEAARALAHLGRAHTALGDHQAAERVLDQAADLFRSTGSPTWEARTLELHGELAEAREASQQALDCYEASLARYQALGAPDVQRLTAKLDRLREAPPAPAPAPEPAPAPASEPASAPD